ncbi:hypothetical protein Amet_3648 [Alkaliphilus metalliredigens QYMF]|uniref:Uncharacterized protein n=1 Tax=Alkaliphilus metalliredigens (strain QYMF) TaxID=293826 RepID=A6TUA2_ALKMQ|nr:bacillithiol system redox-active protein YtxJ [Alkaliphilus metalliredigens]ABR49770.1 hypothetical protein Amet_3648 [Alkaliphilus metalliredigens QYMF]
MAKKIKEIDTVEDLEKLIKKSHKKPVFIFKHDVAKQESEDVFQQYKDFIEENEEDIMSTVVYVREDMEVSDAVEELLEVNHDTPQIILVIEAEVAWDESGNGITTDQLLEVVSEFVGF